MAGTDARREAEALEWIRRIADPEFTDWEGHLAWLEGDAANARAFDRALALIEDATERLASAAPSDVRLPPVPVNDNPPRRRGAWVKAAIAAGIVAIAGGVALMGIEAPHDGGASLHKIATHAGEIRSVMLADGSRASLNGGSAIELDRRDDRTVRVLDGEVFFDVRHDAKHPFRAIVGETEFEDVGTAFDVRRLPDTITVSVAEGAVVFDPGHAAVRLDRGQTVTIAHGAAVVRQTDPQAAGAWRDGRLICHDEPIATVAADISRATGVPIAVDGALASRRFSGVIVLSPDRARMFARIAMVMDVSAERRGPGWRLSPRLG